MKSTENDNHSTRTNSRDQGNVDDGVLYLVHELSVLSHISMSHIHPFRREKMNLILPVHHGSPVHHLHLKKVSFYISRKESKKNILKRNFMISWKHWAQKNKNKSPAVSSKSNFCFLYISPHLSVVFKSLFAKHAQRNSYSTDAWSILL